MRARLWKKLTKRARAEARALGISEYGGYFVAYDPVNRVNFVLGSPLPRRREVEPHPGRVITHGIARVVMSMMS